MFSSSSLEWFSLKHEHIHILLLSFERKPECFDWLFNWVDSYKDGFVSDMIRCKREDARKLCAFSKHMQSQLWIIWKILKKIYIWVAFILKFFESLAFPVQCAMCIHFCRYLNNLNTIYQVCMFHILIDVTICRTLKHFFRKRIDKILRIYRNYFVSLYPHSLRLYGIIYTWSHTHLR